MSEVTQFVFGLFRIDIADRRLWNEQQAVKLSPLAFTLLAHLVKNPGRLVTKEGLLRAISRPESTDYTLQGLVSEVRKALGDKSRQSQFIETVSGEGYRFIASVTTQDSDAGIKSTPTTISDTWQVPTAFVGRDTELADLNSLLEKALGGERQIVFLSGESGIGKTTVARAFLKEVAAAGLAAVGRGQCIGHYGAGEAYLPVLEAITRLFRSPGGESLPSWFRQHAPTWLIQMPSFLEPADYEVLQRQLQGTTRERMLRELLEAVELLTPEYPLVLLLEDLHWSDYSTLDLLSALARRSDQARLLVMGTYRPAEGLAGTHPLCSFLSELQSHGQCSELALRGLQTTDVEHFLAKRFPTGALPLRLPFLLQQRTEGNPLFLVNLVNDLVEQKLLVEDDGVWSFQGTLEAIATQIPKTSRQLIARQIERLPPQIALTLEAASVAGIEFSAAAVAAALQTDANEIEQHCNTLARREEFLRRTGVSDWPDGTQAARYTFDHTLYQDLWQERVPTQQRQWFHLEIAERLEQGFRSRTGEIALELAIHFEEGRNYNKALHYRAQAADTALQRWAYQEAVIHLTKGLQFLNTLPEMPDRIQQELKLRSTLGISLQAIQGYGNPGVEETHARSRELSQQIREPAQLFLALFGLWQFHLARAEYNIARELGEQLFSLAHGSSDRSLLVEAYGVVGVTVFYLGELLAARTALEEAMARYDSQQHRTLAFVYGQDPWVACGGVLSQALWLLGYPDQAQQLSKKTLKYAQELGHPFSQAFALHECALLGQFVQDVPTVQKHAEELFLLAHQHKFPFWELAAASLQAWLLTEQGQGMKSIAQMRQGSSVRKATGTALRLPYHQACLATTYGKSGSVGDGISLIEKAIATVTATGEHWWEAELYRLKGELTLQSQASRGKFELPNTKNPMSKVQSEAEACFHKAIEIAQRQHAKSLELRAAMSMARLWKAQGQKKKAHTLLSEVYGWFAEGFDTTDLQEAKALLTTFK